MGISHVRRKWLNGNICQMQVSMLLKYTIYYTNIKLQYAKFKLWPQQNTKTSIKLYYANIRG